MPHSEIDAIYTKRAELGKAISVLAMLDAVLDNHAFGVVLLGKRVEEAKKRVEGFAEAKEKRGGKKRKLTAYHGDGAKKDWNDLMKRVEQLIDETGTLELAVETMVSGEVEEKSEKSSPGIEEGDGKSSDDGDGEGEDVEIENSD